MDDATLNPQPDARQGPEDDLVRIVAVAGARRLATRPSGRSRSEGGITNRNYRARFGGTRLRDPRSRARTRRCWRSTARPSGSPTSAPPRSGSRRRWRRCSPTRRRSSPMFVEGGGMEPAELRRPESAERRGARRCGPSTSSASRSRPSFDSFRIVETYAATAGERGAELPGAYAEAHEHASADRGGAAAGRSTSRFPATTTSWPPTSFVGEQLWIVDWEYAGMGDRYFDLANFAVNNELGEAARGGAARRLLRRAPPSAATARRACG